MLKQRGDPIQWSGFLLFHCVLLLFFPPPNHFLLKVHIFQGAANASGFLREGDPGTKCGPSHSDGCWWWGLLGAQSPGPGSIQGAQSGTKAGGGKEKTTDEPPTAQSQGPPRSQGWRHRHIQPRQGQVSLGLSLHRAPGPWAVAEGGSPGWGCSGRLRPLDTFGALTVSGNEWGPNLSVCLLEFCTGQEQTSQHEWRANGQLRL